MSETKLGFVNIAAGTVVDRVEEQLAKMQIAKARHLEEYISAVMNRDKGFASRIMFGAVPRTREQAIEIIHSDMFSGYEFAQYTPDYKSSKALGLEKLARVATALLSGGNPNMQISIEAADWLYAE
jgi:hypothetical protein